MFQYTLDNKRYHTLNYFYRQKFHQKVFKVPLDAHFGCPNKKNNQGCIYCLDSSKANIINNQDDIKTQFFKNIQLLEKKWPNSLYIPYFQAGTNTYSTLNHLQKTYEELLTYPKVVGIAIATRPDALTPEIIEYLAKLNQKTFVTIELGLQSSNDNTLKFIKRGHDTNCFIKAVQELKKHHIFTVAHIINGLPYEKEEDMLKTVQLLNDLQIDGLKIHMLFISQNTELAQIYQKQKFPILTKEEYIDIVIKQLEILNPKIVIERITGDPIKEELIAPEWLLKKFCVLNDIDKKMVEKNTYQGKNYKNNS